MAGDAAQLNRWHNPWKLLHLNKDGCVTRQDLPAATSWAFVPRSSLEELPMNVPEEALRGTDTVWHYGNKRLMFWQVCLEMETAAIKEGKEFVAVMLSRSWQIVDTNIFSQVGSGFINGSSFLIEHSICPVYVA